MQLGTLSIHYLLLALSIQPCLMIYVTLRTAILVTCNDTLLAYCNNVMLSTTIDSRGLIADIIAFSSETWYKKLKVELRCRM